jgi:hypothetical protein
VQLFLDELPPAMQQRITVLLLLLLYVLRKRLPTEVM